MDALTIDQFRTFVAIVDGGGFSAAARMMHRSQSAVTYTIQKLEDQIGLALFDRSGYRPAMTEAARALLPRARRVVDDVSAFHAQARGIANGLEPEIALVIDPVFPMTSLLDAMRELRTEFSEVRTRVYAESLGGGIRLLRNGTATIAIVIAFTIPEVGFERLPLNRIALAMVVAPHHPLALRSGRLGSEDMRDHVQLVLTDRSGLTGSRDYGVFGDQTWRLGDLSTKHAMLLAGFGFGSMPEHMVADDLAAGRLVRILPQQWDGDADAPKLSMCAVWPSDNLPGPAGRRLLERLAAGRSEDEPTG